MRPIWLAVLLSAGCLATFEKPVDVSAGELFPFDPGPSPVNGTGAGFVALGSAYQRTLSNASRWIDASSKDLDPGDQAAVPARLLDVRAALDRGDLRIVKMEHNVVGEAWVLATVGRLEVHANDTRGLERKTDALLEDTTDRLASRPTVVGHGRLGLAWFFRASESEGDLHPIQVGWSYGYLAEYSAFADAMSNEGPEALSTPCVRAYLERVQQRLNETQAADEDRLVSAYASAREVYMPAAWSALPRDNAHGAFMLAIQADVSLSRHQVGKSMQSMRPTLENETFQSSWRELLENADDPVIASLALDFLKNWQQAHAAKHDPLLPEHGWETGGYLAAAGPGILQGVSSEVKACRNVV